MKITHSKKKPVMPKEKVKILIRRLSSGNVESIILYGSQLSGNLSNSSDLDLLVTIKELEGKTIKNLIKNKTELERTLKIPISLNIHTLDELDPLLKKRNIFMHKNRSEFMIYKYKYHYLCIYGKNPFRLFDDPTPKQIREESIKLLLSFSYNLKKFILNPELAPHKEKEFIRTPLISLEYIAAFYGYISLDKYDAFKFLIRNNLIEKKHINFIKKIVKKNYLSFKEKIESINFIDYYRKLLVKEYLNFAQSDIRYVNKKIKFHWNLKYPQAVSMAILKHKSKILLLKRTSDDYLYPNMWTLPGGYLKKNETFEECIRREIFEETGLSGLDIIGLFKHKKVITKRVAVGCFLVQLNNQEINLSEHSNYGFFDFKKLNNLNLTPECKKVLTKYLINKI
jgi:ADP-ribose pyrophosphatase YjhB (NUDIX family)/predicted nucleotidyltransferase